MKSSKKEVANLARQKKSAQDAKKKGKTATTAEAGAAVTISDKRESKRTAKQEVFGTVKKRSKSQQVPASTAP